ncbi:hypothetical protein Tco_0550757 [Tanacetum coccineum]
MKVVVHGDDDEVETVRMEAAVGSGSCFGSGCGNDVDGGVRVAMAVLAVGGDDNGVGGGGVVQRWPKSGRMWETTPEKKKEEKCVLG